jgi:uncharacterized protein (DUF58 family)
MKFFISALKNPFQRLKRLEKGFFEGPSWIDKPRWLSRKKKGYRSPTVYLFLWVYACYSRLFTIPGRLMASAAFLIILYGAVLGGPIRTLAFALIAVLCVDFIFGFVFRPKLRIDRKVPCRIRAGEPIKVEYEISNIRSLPAWNIHIDTIRQQGWLNLEADVASVDSIPGKSRAYIRSYLQARARGEYTFNPPTASSAFPFGILKWTCVGRERQQILVYPKFAPLNSLELPVSPRFQREGMNLASKVGESLEFHACREFRVGDNPKHIHWPTTARKNELVIREYQEEHLSRIALLVDTYTPEVNKFFTLKIKRESPELEAALSITTALSHHLARGDHIVDIFAIGPDIYHFKGGRSLAQFDQILDILACIEPNKKDAIADLETEVLEEIAGIGSAVLALLRWDEPRKRLVEELREQGVAVKILIINDSPPSRAPMGSVILSPEDILEGKVRDL